MLIVDRPDFQLEAKTTPTTQDRYSFELWQRWPKAEHPHFRRICQLNLTGAEVARFINALEDRG